MGARVKSTEWTPKDLIGKVVRIPTQKALEGGPDCAGGGKGWWVRITHADDTGRCVRIEGGKMFGRPRWVALEGVCFGTQWERKAAALMLARLGAKGLYGAEIDAPL